MSASIVMAGIVRIIGINMRVSIITTIVQIMTGMIVYLTVLLLMKEEIDKLFFEFIKVKIFKFKFGSEYSQ